MIGADTRLSTGYRILSRTSSKIAEVSSNVFLATSGMYADFTALKKMLGIRLTQYEHT